MMVLIDRLGPSCLVRGPRMSEPQEPLAGSKRLGGVTPALGYERANPTRHFSMRKDQQNGGSSIDS
jgi:hypothetical protein